VWSKAAMSKKTQKTQSAERRPKKNSASRTSAEKND